ncbi:MAG: BRO family protein [Lentisphaeria bacterium]
MSKELVTLVHEFEGKDVTTFLYKGRPAWVARELGEVLGYADGGKALVTMLTREWANEVQEGPDFRFVNGAELSDLKKLLELGVSHTPSSQVRSRPIPIHAPSAVILFEPGLHLVLLKTDKPAGKRLRRMLVDVVLPQLVRDGKFDPERTVTPQGEFQPKTRRPALDREAQAVRRLEYRRLALQRELREMEVDLQRASSILYAADRMGSQTEADAARREAVLLLAGRPVDFLPSGIPQAPAAPSSPPSPRLGPQQSLPLQQGFPTRPLSSLDAEREKRLAQMANRQSPFGVNPPTGGGTDGEGAKR